MKIVSIGFSRPHKWKIFAKLIMLVEGTDFSHSFVTWKDEEIDRRKVFEAVGSGVRIVGNKIFKKNAYVTHVYSFKVPEEVIVGLEQYSHDQSGKPYGYKHVIGLLIMRFARLLGIKTSNPFKDGEYSQICVESGAYILQNALGIDLPGNVEDYGLREYKALIDGHGDPADKEKLDKINGIKG